MLMSEPARFIKTTGKQTLKTISKIITLIALFVAVTASAATKPTISAVSVYDVTQNAAKVTWTVSQYATGQVQYGKTAAYGQVSVKETSFQYKTHIQQLMGLSPGTLYHFRAISANRAGVTVVSGDSAFNTIGATLLVVIPPVEPPIVVVPVTPPAKPPTIPAAKPRGPGNKPPAFDNN